MKDMGKRGYVDSRRSGDAETREQTLEKLKFFVSKMTDEELRMLTAVARGMIKKG